MPDQISPPLSRRQFSRLVAASTAALLSPEAQAEAAAPQAATAPPAVAETRITQIEKEHGRPLTPQQRRKMGAVLKDLDETLAAVRKAAVSDGGGEPVTAFAPLRPARPAKKGA